MQIKINSDSQIDIDARFVDHWESEIESSLERFSDRLTRIEVHLTDENSHAKGGADDIRCLMEARPAGQKPISIEVRGASVELALQDGIGTLSRRLANMVEKARTEARKRPEEPMA